MTDTSDQRALSRNIVKYAWYKIFTKRLYLPLIAIQLVNVGKVTLEEIALIAIITSIAQLVLQMPTGYFADRFGNKRSFVIGSLIALPSPLFYIFMPDFYGGLLSSLLFFGGYAFQQGAVEAFIHDTTVALGREHDYTKILGRSQSFGLIGNVILIAIVPATYAIDPTLPFWLGFVSLGMMVLLTVSMVTPHVDHETHRPIKNPWRALQTAVTLQTIPVFLLVGFLSGITNRVGDYSTLLFESLGIAVALFGGIQAVSSLVAAGFGFVVHWFDKVGPRAFYLIDTLVIAILIIAMGFFHSPVPVVVASIILSAYCRVRLIVVQSKLLATVRHHYKATLLSALALFSPIGDIVSAIMLARFATDHGYSDGYLYYGLVTLAIGMVLWLLVMLALTKMHIRKSPV